MKGNFLNSVLVCWMLLGLLLVSCNYPLPTQPGAAPLPEDGVSTPLPVSSPLATQEPSAAGVPGDSQPIEEPASQPPASPPPAEATAIPIPAAPEAGAAETLAEPAVPEVKNTTGTTLIFPLIVVQPAVWIDPRLPTRLRESVARSGTMVVDQPEQARLRLEPGSQSPVSRWVYALVAPFPTRHPGVSAEDLLRAWRGEPAGPFAGRPLLMEESTQAVFALQWGAPGPEAVSVLPSAELLGYAWDHQPAWAIVPFEALEPRWKVLEVDGLSPLHKAFDPQAYALSTPVSLLGDPEPAAAFALLVPSTNRDANKLTVLTMTGVTALVRATAHTMERQGILYPGRDVGDWLRSADLTHISNEVPFASNCPFPNPVQADVRFCSDPRYIALLEDVGTDIVELTGDHFQDWGTDAMYFTLELYRERGWLYYGGGANLEEGRQAITIEHNGNRLAFIGCNGKGGSFAQASANRPGAVTCDFGWMQQEIARLRAEGYLPIVTFQHFEYYTYQAQPNQIRDFRSVAEAGAVIVSGSQAHQPQALEFHSEALIHYGLGNLFFDQYSVSLATRQAFIDRHVFYDNRYIGTELLPILFVDYARPRPMTPEERNELLNAVFGASGW